MSIYYIMRIFQKEMTLSQNSLVSCSSLYRIEVSWAFPVHFSVSVTGFDQLLSHVGESLHV